MEGLVQESKLEWFSFKKGQPLTNRITFQRKMFKDRNEHAGGLRNQDYAQLPLHYFEETIEYQDFEVSKAYYSRKNDNKNIWTHIQLQASPNLVMFTPVYESKLEIPPILGAWFFIMYCLGLFIARLVYPFFMYLSVIVRLFKIDPNKGQVPRDPLAVEKLPAA